MSVSERTRKPLIIRPEQGRQYDMGRIRAVFFADKAETDNRYSISEWWLEARTSGPSIHSHPEDHIYYVLAGTLSLLIDGKRAEATRGTYAVIPGGAEHSFDNRGSEECGFISINTPAGFEQQMPGIVEWFSKNPPGDVSDA